MVDKPIFQADSVGWSGLCPCGCGAYKAVLIDEQDEPFATFGWDRQGWVDFMEGVLRQIDEESNGRTQEEDEGDHVHDHTAH